MVKGNGLERERKTLRVMLEIHCRGNHGGGDKLCEQCEPLWEYAEVRLDKCPFGEEKGPCSACKVHCYKPDMRERVREIMRYSGPRMLKRHPVLAVDHLVKGWKHKRKNSG